jgi:hypothetical protein
MGKTYKDSDRKDKNKTPKYRRTSKRYTPKKYRGRNVEEKKEDTWANEDNIYDEEEDFEKFRKRK